MFKYQPEQIAAQKLTMKINQQRLNSQPSVTVTAINKNSHFPNATNNVLSPVLKYNTSIPFLSFPRFVIDYCQLGFIGKLFKSTDLPTLIQFFLMFYNDKPVDWLLENVIQTMVCKLDQDLKTCKKEKAMLWVHFKPSLFQV